MKKALSLLTMTLALVASCSSVGYDDPDMVETLTIDFGSTDLQILASSMTESLIASPGLSYVKRSASNSNEDPRLVVYLGGIENRTTEHIDTSGIGESIRTSLLSSGKFRFVARDPGQAEIGGQVYFQQGSGRVDPTQAKAFGKQLGADMVVYGTLRSIDKKKGSSIESLGSKKEDLYYQFIMNCVNIETGEIVWAKEEDIRKRASTGIFGR